MKAPRLPDFIIVGALKSGTTTLFRWLATHPGTSLKTKEPHFFSGEAAWGRGIDWYRSLFEAAGDDVVTGEASATYTSMAAAPIAAARIAEVVPGALNSSTSCANRWRGCVRTTDKRPFVASSNAPSARCCAIPPPAS